MTLIACGCGRPYGAAFEFERPEFKFIKDGRPVKPGEPGSIVVTDLTNYGMPFDFRYKVGDVGIPADKRCSCGRSLPLHAKLGGASCRLRCHGRRNLICGISLTENFATKIPEIKQLQIIQERTDFLIFKIVKRRELFSNYREID